MLSSFKFALDCFFQKLSIAVTVLRLIRFIIFNHIFSKEERETIVNILFEL